MKIREGLVANSSTTSFSLYGVYVEDYDINEVIQVLKNLPKFEERKRRLIKDYHESSYHEPNPDATFEDVLEYYLEDGLGEFIGWIWGGDLNIDVEGARWGEYIGYPVQAMKMDETREEFENRVKDLLSPLGSCNWHTEAFSNY